MGPAASVAPRQPASPICQHVGASGSETGGFNVYRGLSNNDSQYAPDAFSDYEDPDIFGFWDPGDLIGALWPSGVAKGCLQGVTMHVFGQK